MTEGLPSLIVDADAPVDSAEPWHRLSARMIVVDLVWSLLAVSPTVLAFVVFDVPMNGATVGPLAFIAVTGVGGAVADVIRWITTRYRVTDDYVERATGLFVTRYRSIRRDRIRSIDLDAKLRHRLAGLRVVLVGAGQQSAAAQSALSLSAVTRVDAEALRARLLGREAEESDEREVLATFHGWWAVYHTVGVWALLLAAGLVWGGGWFLATFGVDVVRLTGGLLDTGEHGWPRVLLTGFAFMAVAGAIAGAVRYVSAYWDFELARVATGSGTALRTRHGFFRTREVNRDDARLRGLMISEPVLWRWIGMTDTEVVTTGLSIWSSNAPSSILPRGPRPVALGVAAQVLGDDLMATPLARHPAAALRRRLVWMSVVWAVATATALYLWRAPGIPGVVPASIGATLPVLLLGAFVAYRALGNAIVGPYAIVRSGFLARRTVALQRAAVSTVKVRESVLQRRLGLRSVGLATAAGWGEYAAPDLARADAVALARDAAPGLLDPFIVEGG